MRKLLFTAATLALLSSVPVSAKTVCEKMKRQYPQGYCDKAGAFHPGNGTVVSRKGRTSPERNEPSIAPPPPPPPPPMVGSSPRSHSGTSGAPQSFTGSAPPHSGTSGDPQ